MKSECTLVKFRDCTESDLDILQQLVDEFYAGDHHLTANPPNIFLTYQELSLHPDKGRIVVFESNGQPAGYAILIFFWSNEFKGDIIEVDELVVHKSHRNLGIATKFFAWLQAEYASKCAGLSLQVAHSNHGAQKLYQREGFKPAPNLHLLKLIQSTDSSKA